MFVVGFFENLDGVFDVILEESVGGDYGVLGWVFFECFVRYGFFIFRFIGLIVVVYF